MYIVVEPCSCVPTGVVCAESSIANGRVPVAELNSRNPPCRLTNVHCNISLSIATRGEINIRWNVQSPSRTNRSSGNVRNTAKNIKSHDFLDFEKS